MILYTTIAPVITIACRNIRYYSFLLYCILYFIPQHGYGYLANKDGSQIKASMQQKFSINLDHLEASASSISEKSAYTLNFNASYDIATTSHHASIQDLLYFYANTKHDISVKAMPNLILVGAALPAFRYIDPQLGHTTQPMLMLLQKSARKWIVGGIAAAVLTIATIVYFTKISNKYHPSELSPSSSMLHSIESSNADSENSKVIEEIHQNELQIYQNLRDSGPEGEYKLLLPALREDEKELNRELEVFKLEIDFLQTESTEVSIQKSKLILTDYLETQVALTYITRMIAEVESRQKNYQKTGSIKEWVEAIDSAILRSKIAFIEYLQESKKTTSTPPKLEEDIE